MIKRPYAMLYYNVYRFSTNPNNKYMHKWNRFACYLSLSLSLLSSLNQIQNRINEWIVFANVSSVRARLCAALSIAMKLPHSLTSIDYEYCLVQSCNEALSHCWMRKQSFCVDSFVKNRTVKIKISTKTTVDIALYKTHWLMLREKWA